jgi:hypothetical protein
MKADNEAGAVIHSAPVPNNRSFCEAFLLAHTSIMLSQLIRSHSPGAFFFGAAFFIV